MKMLRILVLIGILSTFLAAQNLGSMSLMHTHTGRVFDPGRFEIQTNMNFYTKLADFVGSPNLKPSDFTAANWWDVSSNLILSFGLLKNFDLTIAPRIYQDTQSSNEFNVPGDIFITLKGGSFAMAGRRLYLAGMMNLRIGTGEVHNYPFREYASGALEFGFATALSYYLDPYLPDRSASFHLNLGWYNHNEAGKDIDIRGISTKKSGVNSTEFRYAIGFLYPLDEFDLRLEAYGTSFIQQPETFVFSRDDFTYVTPSIRYKAFSWLSMDLGVDIRVSSADKIFTTIDLPRYSDWRANLGLRIKVLPLSEDEDSPQQLERRQFNKRVEFFQSIIQEREKAENVQEELDKLIKEREEAESELEELKQILEEEGN